MQSRDGRDNGDRARGQFEDAANEGGPIVTACGLTKRYGSGEASVDALCGVSLDVERGKLTAVMGPSGSGKSTLMHILAGLDHPTEGTVSLDGQEITGMDDTALTKLRRRKIGFVFQFFNLLPMLSVAENVVLPLSLSGATTDVAYVDDLLEQVGLTARRRHRPAELSGGQQQRVAIARALVTRPAIVFADEPSGNLDSRSSAEILGILRDSVDVYRQTTVMITHDPQAAAFADRIVVLADGLIVDDRAALSSADVGRAASGLGVS
jgi:putative ABC transport system ATP-binding protein